MPPKQMIPRVEVMPLLKLRFKSKASSSAVSFSSSISQDLRELKTAKVTTRIGKLRDRRLISLCWRSKNVLDHSISRREYKGKGNMCHSVRVNSQWS
jgi:hypothetical protein